VQRPEVMTGISRAGAAPPAARLAASRALHRRPPVRPAAVVIIIAVLLGSMVAARSADRQAECTAQAQTTFRDVTREYVAVLESLNLPFEITSNSFEAHYNGKVGRCLLLVRKTASVLRSSSDIVYLLDADSRYIYALYADADGKMQSCALMRSPRDTQTCQARREFDAFVADYLNN
jgi:hypothetical protein